MTSRATARVFSVPPGAPFLQTVVAALRAGTLVPGFETGGDPLALSRATIYVPTRRAARALRAIFAETGDGSPAILPSIRALGEFDEGEAAFDAENAAALDLLPPISRLDRLLLLAPMAWRWKQRLPAEVARLYEEEVVVPVSSADSIWLARDLARLMDDVETEQTDWAKLSALVADDYAGWWQVTLKFLEIVTEHWPGVLAERGQSNPAAHRNALLAHEAARLTRNSPDGPVIAAGSTGSIPATAELLAAIARLPNGALVLPGLDLGMDERSWAELGQRDERPAVVGHPQFGLRRLIERLGVSRADVVEIGEPPQPLTARARLLGEALRPSETTDAWSKVRAGISAADARAALQGVTLVDATNEREEALAIACAIRLSLEKPNHSVALVTADRALARRVGAELLRFGIEADDSGGTPLATSPGAALLRTLLAAAFGDADPVRILSLVKHPLLRLGWPLQRIRAAAGTIDLVALRGGSGRPTLKTLGDHFEAHWQALRTDHRNANWFARIDATRLADAREAIRRLEGAVAPLHDLASTNSPPLAALTQASIAAFEALGRDEGGGLDALYAGNGGEKLVEFLRGLVAATTPYTMRPAEWPDVFDALIATETVKPRATDDGRVAIWGTLEARLQPVDMLILGGLNEGSWPRKLRGGRFLSRVMRGGIDLDPPEREIGLAAHDFQMAMGSSEVILTRSARSGDSPAVPSRWLQRFTTFIGEKETQAIKSRGDSLLTSANRLDEGKDQSIPRAHYAPPLDVRPTSFSVTEIETLRRDPYAVYARRVLGLKPIEPLIRDPGVAERGTLFHLILHRFTQSGVTDALDAAARLLAIGAAAFAEAKLPLDVAGVWWPRFERMVPNLVAFERERAPMLRATHAEVRAARTEVNRTGVNLSGTADRIDVMDDGRAVIIDYKTGSSPSKKQAHTLLAPQLPLEAALMQRGAFAAIGPLAASDLLYVRLKANGMVEPDSILEHNRKTVAADTLGEQAWGRLEELLVWFADPANAYRSRTLPFKESDMDGDYDHLARVMEWSAGAEEEDEYGSGGA